MTEHLCVQCFQAHTPCCWQCGCRAWNRGPDGTERPPLEVIDATYWPRPPTPMPVVAPGVRGLVWDGDRLSLWITWLQAEREGAGDVGRYLDSLPSDRDVIVVSVISSRLVGMLQRRGFVPDRDVMTWDGETIDGWLLARAVSA